MRYSTLIACIVLFLLNTGQAVSQQKPRFRILALAENGGHHLRYSEAARNWLNRLGSDSNFVIDYLTTTDPINENLLAGYQLFIQLDYPPYAWKKEAVTAFEKYITTGAGGWIGFHHATLLGEFDGYPMWDWFSAFMGNIRFTNYIPAFADGTVTVEDSTHPCMKGLPRNFIIEKEEWYTYNNSPRSNVSVLASVDEQSYKPGSPVKMGDHPVVWTNTRFAARNIYIFMGHGPELFGNDVYTTLFRNAIFWAAGQHKK